MVLLGNRESRLLLRVIKLKCWDGLMRQIRLCDDIQLRLARYVDGGEIFAVGWGE